MSTLTLNGTAATSDPAAQRSKADALRIAALALLSIRFIQGFIYWGGGSRRFIYAPAKLDPNAPSWMANKFQSAMPGALLGTDHIIGFLLHHFDLLYASLILFSAAELVAGLCLMTGFLTRAAAAHSRSTAHCWRVTRRSPDGDGFGGCPEPCRFRCEAARFKNLRWRYLRQPLSSTSPPTTIIGARLSRRF